jgi:hypothetical protein
VVCGWFVSHVGGLARNNLAHILGGNTVDQGWKPSADQDVLAIAVSGNLVYVGGEFQNIDGQRRNRIAALDKTNGQISPWNPSALQVVNVLAISGDLVYVGGNFTSIGGQIRNRIAALNANDTTNYVTSRIQTPIESFTRWRLTATRFTSVGILLPSAPNRATAPPPWTPGLARRAIGARTRTELSAHSPLAPTLCMWEGIS